METILSTANSSRRALQWCYPLAPSGEVKQDPPLEELNRIDAITAAGQWCFPRMIRKNLNRGRLNAMQFVPCHFHADKDQKGPCPRAASSHMRVLIFLCCLLITVLTQDKGHQATVLSTHENKLQDDSVFIFSTRTVQKLVSQPSDFNGKHKQERCSSANVPGTVSSYKRRPRRGDGYRVHISSLLGESGGNSQFSKEVKSQSQTRRVSISTETCWQQTDDQVHPTNLDGSSSLITLLQALKLAAVAPLSASGAFECNARNIQSVKKKWFTLFSWRHICDSFKQKLQLIWFTVIQRVHRPAVTFCCSSFLTLSFSMETWR